MQKHNTQVWKFSCCCFRMKAELSRLGGSSVLSCASQKSFGDSRFPGRVQRRCGTAWGRRRRSSGCGRACTWPACWWRSAPVDRRHSRASRGPAHSNSISEGAETTAAGSEDIWRSHSFQNWAQKLISSTDRTSLVCLMFTLAEYDLALTLKL